MKISFFRNSQSYHLTRKGGVGLTALLLLLPLALFADVKVTVQAPQQVEEGQRVRVSYVVNTQNIEDFQVGEFQGFELLYGPSTSQQSSFQMINGRTTQSSSVTFTYTLLAQKAGTYKIPVGMVKSDGKAYKSGQPSVQILPGGSDGGGSGGGQQGSQRQQATHMRTQDAGDRVTAKDLYITVTASKHRLYEQEAVLLTYKLYTLVSIDQCVGKMPELDGFHVQEVELPQQKSLTYERVNGKNYGTVVWSQYVLFPQKTGKLTVPALNFEAEVVQQERSIDPFEAFFGGGSSLVRVKKTVVAPAVELQVDALPQRPVNFSGAVGTNFHVSGTLTPQQVDANDAVQLRLIVSGTGNMKLMNAPKVEWPKDFESYDPKVNEKTKPSTSGATGNVVYDYTVVPRHGGRYTIPPVEFCYFDTKTRQYTTVRTDSFQLAVAKGVQRASRQSASQEDLKVLNSDIRYIRTGDRGTGKQGMNFFSTPKYWGGYGAALVAFVVVLALFYRQAKANANVARRRGKKAGKAAAKHLKSASKLLRQGQPEAFYDEVMRALWGYAGDKLNLPVADLNKDNVGAELTARSVDEGTVEHFLRVLGDCEFARFAPGDPAATMDKLFDEATEVINQMDSAL
ncbi:MAG: protein BatD [Bacteroidaceae bacterium]|nr:protein BatD [Bacteroidaceae bacterium]